MKIQNHVASLLKFDIYSDPHTFPYRYKIFL